MFSLFYPSLPGPGRQPNKTYFGSSFFWNLGYDPRL